MPPKFQLYKDATGKFRFRVVAENGQTVASSEAYQQYASCLKGINSVKKNSGSNVEDLTINDRKVLNPKYQIYKDAAGKFRFRLKASNGEIIAQSEGYETKDGCKNGIEAVRNSKDGKIDDSLVIGEVHPVRSDANELVSPAKTTTTEAKVETPKAEAPEVKTPDVKMTEAASQVRVTGEEKPEIKTLEIAKPELEAKPFPPQLEMPETKQALPEIKEEPEKLPPPRVETEAPQETDKAKPKRARGWL